MANIDMTPAEQQAITDAVANIPKSYLEKVCREAVVGVLADFNRNGLTMVKDAVREQIATEVRNLLEGEFKSQLEPKIRQAASEMLAKIK